MTYASDDVNVLVQNMMLSPDIALILAERAFDGADPRFVNGVYRSVEEQVCATANALAEASVQVANFATLPNWKLERRKTCTTCHCDKTLGPPAGWMSEDAKIEFGELSKTKQSQHASWCRPCEVDKHCQCKFCEFARAI